MPIIIPSSSAGGHTFSELVNLVLSNSFSSTRYETFTKRYLNDAVTDVCRRMQIIRDMETVEYDSDGIVTQPARPFFLVEDVWLADGSGAVSFTARRPVGPDTDYPQVEIELDPVSSAGTVIIIGLRRPLLMVADDDTSGLGADLDNALVAFAKARLFEHEDDFEMSQRWDAKYQEHLVVNSQPTHYAAPVITPGTWYDWGTSWGR